MKKEAIIACIIACFSCATVTLFAKTTKIVDGCVFCGGAELIIDDDVPVIEKPSSGCVFCGSGENPSGVNNNWKTATTRSAYLVDDEGEYAGIATITTGKKSSKGKVSVKISAKMASGTKWSTAKTSFLLDDDGSIYAAWSNVKNIGTVNVILSSDGEVDGSAGIYEFSDEYSNGDDDDGMFVHGEHSFSVDMGDYELSDAYAFVDETVPTDAVIFTSNSKKWDCGKAPSIKYKKIKEDGETWYELVGLDDEEKTNYSGLKLSYDKKKGTFKGSFKIYASNEGSIEKGKPKLKSYSFSVSGKISGGSCTGVATCKKLKASWSVTID